MVQSYKHNFWDYLEYLLMILCFPLNPLVLLNIVEPNSKNLLSISGTIIWLAGMILVIYPVIYFKLKGKVKKGKSYVHTNRIVKTGLYSIIRHVQYTGGILSIFIATPLLYPHWIFVLLGIPGILLTYLGARREDVFLIEKFGNEYKGYMEKVPSINIFVGLIRKIRGNKMAN